MGIRRGARFRRVVGLGVLGVGAVGTLAGCNLGVAPVTYELVDAEDFDWPLEPSGMATGDIDGDGDVDVVATGRDGYATLTNDGTGTFALDFPSSGGGSSGAPSLADVEGDGDVDLVSTVSLGDSVPAVRRNDGTGTFGAVEVVSPDPPPGGVSDMVVSDLDGDGDIDLVAAVLVGQDRHVATYLNDGTGAFGPPVTHALGYSSDRVTPVRLALGDLDGDGDDDVVGTDEGEITTPDGDVIEGTLAMVGINDGTGAFTATGGPLEVGFAGFVWALPPTLADLDEDGTPDLAVGGPGSITTLLGDGTGGFTTPRRSTVPGTRRVDELTAADIDDDGHLDLVGFEELVDPRSGVIVYGDGAGGVDAVHEVGSGTALGGSGIGGLEVETADLEADGDVDVLFLAGSLGVVENAVNGRPNH
jgi:hypothetical protein